jgi:ornithine decarboxylase
MNDAKFILSKSKLLNQVKILEKLGLTISYSYKTNRQVGNLLQKLTPNVNYSIHATEEIEMIKDKSKISFFTQAESINELEKIMTKGITKFVIDNKIDLESVLMASKNLSSKINISIRMKFQENRIGTGKYFVYGIPSREVNKIISKLKNNSQVDKIGIHIHRKSQNTSEWEIKEELIDSLTEETLQRINEINLGGGLPANYRSYNSNITKYIFEKLTQTRKFLKKYNITPVIEPGRFLAAPCINLQTTIIQIQEKNIILNTTIYNCALDTVLTGTKMLVKEELEPNEEWIFFLLKGNSPTRDDIFRYKVKLKNPKVGDTITFLNAGAYNYTTDFFGYKKLETIIID